MSLFDYVARHARAILFVIVMFAASGVGLMLNMPVSLFPDITFPRIVVLADNGEEPAERMMVEVTKPLEEVASSIPGVKGTRARRASAPTTTRAASPRSCSIPTATTLEAVTHDAT